MSESPEWRGTREDVRSVGNRVTEVGLEYFCPDYVSKNGVSVTECNSIPPSRTSSRGPIEFRGRFGLGWDRNLGAADIKRVQFVGSASLLLFHNVLASREA